MTASETQSLNAMNLMLAAADTLITLLVFVLISAAASFLKKKGKGGPLLEEWTDEPDAPPAPPSVRRGTSPQPAPPAQPKPTDWEQELRRLLGGEEPDYAPLPPVVIHEPPKSTPAPPVVAVPRPRPERVPEKVTRWQTVVQSVEDMHGANRASMAESAQAYQRASQLEASVAAHMERVTHMPVLKTVVRHRKARTVEMDQVVALFRNPGTARQAVIASVILGAPTGLDGRPGF